MLKNTLRKGALLTTLSALAVSAIANPEVVPGYSKLSMTYQESSINGDFDDQAEVLNTIYNYPLCFEAGVDPVNCLFNEGVTVVPDNQGGNALKVQGTGDYGNGNNEPGNVIYGELSDYGYGDVNIAQQAFLFFQGVWLPGAAPAPEGTVFEETESYTASVDFQVTRSAGGTDSRQIIYLGSSRLVIHQPDDGAPTTVNFTAPGNPSDLNDPFEIREHIIPVGALGSFPEAEWLTYSISYDAVAGTLTHTLASKSAGSSLPVLTHVEADVYPFIQAGPLAAVTDIVVYSTGDKYDSSVTLDNYVNSGIEIGYYAVNFSPLTYNGIDYVNGDITGAPESIFVYGDFIMTPDGYRPQIFEYVYTDGHAISPVLKGEVGDNFSILLLTHPSGDHQTVFGEGSYELMLEVTAPLGISIDQFYPDVFLAQGAGQDYVINPIYLEPSAPEVPETAVIALESLAQPSGQAHQVMGSVCQSITFAEDNDLAAAVDKLNHAAAKVAQLNAKGDISDEDAEALQAWLADLLAFLEFDIAAYPTVIDTLPESACDGGPVAVGNANGSAGKGNNNGNAGNGGNNVANGLTVSLDSYNSVITPITDGVAVTSNNSDETVFAAATDAGAITPSSVETGIYIQLDVTNNNAHYLYAFFTDGIMGPFGDATELLGVVIGYDNGQTYVGVGDLNSDDDVTWLEGVDYLFGKPLAVSIQVISATEAVINLYDSTDPAAAPAYSHTIDLVASEIDINTINRVILLSASEYGVGPNESTIIHYSNPPLQYDNVTLLQ